MCVFHQESYIKLLKLLITSISEKGNVKANTDILIITSPVFQLLIQKELEGINLPLHYYTLNLQSLMESSCCKLKIFQYPNIDKYEKILYLDTDVLVNSDVNPLFDIDISSEKLHALEEGNIGHVFWGAQFFDFTKNTSSTTAFSAGVFYFMNSVSMRKLFEDTNLHIERYLSTGGSVPTCLDQPFLVYNSVITDKYDNQFMKKYLENNPSVRDDKIIYHFPGGPGDYSSKWAKMTAFWEKMKEQMHTELCLLGKKYAVDKSPFFGNHTYTPNYHTLLNNLRNDIESILEIGIGNIPLMSGLTNSSYKPGASLRMWQDYFPKAAIYGCDILEDVLFNEGRISTFQTDQGNEDSLNKLIRSIGNIDLIIDDGSHIQDHMVTSFKTLWKIIKPRGLYIIEDIHISFFDRIMNLNTEFNLLDATCIMAYKGKFVSDNFVVFKKLDVFDTRKEMVRHYSNKISNPRILEIGVFKGEFLDYLTECSSTVDAVDLFEGNMCSGDVDGNNVVYYDVGKSYLELLEKYKETSVKIYKANSIDFLQSQECSYDIIYLDGDHTYNGVKNDLIHAYQKIKDGGYIMGHDYEMNMKKAKHVYDFGVKKAVDEFCITYNQTILAKGLDGCVSYCIHVKK